VMNFIGFSGRQRSFHIQVEAECILSFGSSLIVMRYVILNVVSKL